MIQHLTELELRQKTKTLALEERRLSLEVLHHLQEIERRGLHLKWAFGSLFDYAVKELGFSEGAAGRRIQALRVLNGVPAEQAPAVEQKIMKGTLSLSTLAQVGHFLKAEKKEKKIYSAEQKLELLNSFESKSRREVEKELARLNPQIIPQEKIRQLTEDQSELRVMLDEDLRQTLDQLKHLLSHINPRMTYQDLIRYMAKRLIVKIDPIEKMKAKFEREQKRLQQSVPLLQ